MKQSKKRSYLKELRIKAGEYEHYNINAVRDSWVIRIKNELILYILSATLVILLNKGFDSKFITFLSTVLSILIGLFLTSLIFALDKFYKPIEDKIEDYELTISKEDYSKDYRLSIKQLVDLNSRQKLWNNQAYNYVKKFTFLTGHNIVLSIYTLLLLSLSTLFADFMANDIYNYSICFKHIDLNTIINFLIVFCLVIQRFLVIFWFLKIFRNTLFVISSMVNFMTTKIERGANAK